MGSMYHDNYRLCCVLCCVRTENTDHCFKKENKISGVHWQTVINAYEIKFSKNNFWFNSQLVFYCIQKKSSKTSLFLSKAEQLLHPISPPLTGGNLPKQSL